MDEPHTAHAKPEPANSAGRDEPAPACAAGSIDASGAAGGTGGSASSGSAGSTLKSAQDARWPAHAAAAQAGEQKRAFRQLAQTSDVDAPQAAHAGRAEAGEDIAMITTCGQRETIELVCATRAHIFLASFFYVPCAALRNSISRTFAFTQQTGLSRYRQCAPGHWWHWHWHWHAAKRRAAAPPGGFR